MHVYPEWRREGRKIEWKCLRMLILISGFFSLKNVTFSWIFGGGCGRRCALSTFRLFSDHREWSVVETLCFGILPRWELIFESRHWILLDSNCRPCLLCISTLGSVLSHSCQCRTHSSGVIRAGAEFVVDSPFLTLSFQGFLFTVQEPWFPWVLSLALQASKTDCKFSMDV